MRSQILLAALFLYSSAGLAQGGIGVPFLLVRPSVEATGWGGVGTGVIIGDPLSLAANPAQLGMSEGSFNAAATSFMSHVNRLSLFPYSQSDFFAYGFKAGFTLDSILPGGVNVGVGYSRIRIDFPFAEYIKTNIDGAETGRFGALETADAFSIGAGTTYVVHFGIGFSFKRVNSRLVPMSDQMTQDTANAATTALDFGVLVRIPVFEILRKVTRQPTAMNDVQPLSALTLGYSRANMGSDLHYFDNSGIPLPLEGTLGLSIELGATLQHGDVQWTILSFTWAREAGDVLTRFIDGAEISAKGGIAGDVSLIDNVLLGRRGDNFELRKGWQFNLGEFLFLRGGSCTLPGSLQDYGVSSETWGIGVRLAGFLECVDVTTSLSERSPAFNFVMRHLDIQYDYARVSQPRGGGASGFNALKVAFR